MKTCRDNTTFCTILPLSIEGLLLLHEGCLVTSRVVKLLIQYIIDLIRKCLKSEANRKLESKTKLISPFLSFGPVDPC